MFLGPGTRQPTDQTARVNYWVPPHQLFAVACLFPVRRHHPKQDHHAIRNAAIRYWERRRIIYNVALMPPSALGYTLTAGVLRAGDDYGWHSIRVLLWFLVSALGANICYTFAYALEFLFCGGDFESRWLRFGRPTAFASGLLFSVLLAAICGRNLAMLEYHFR